MKKTLLVFMLLLSSSVFASQSYDPWIFEPVIGPSIGINDAGNNFLIEPRFGKEYIKGGLGLYLGSSVAFRPHVAIDVPFYFTLDKSNDFMIGPTFDGGPAFNVKGASSIDFLVLGMGLKLGYVIRDDFGVIFVPIHLGMSFFNWVSGRGVDSASAVTYNLKFGIYLNL